jgi:hypothetical protein
MSDDDRLKAMGQVIQIDEAVDAVKFADNINIKVVPTKESHAF